MSKRRSSTIPAPNFIVKGDRISIRVRQDRKGCLSVCGQECAGNRVEAAEEFTDWSVEPVRYRREIPAWHAVGPNILWVIVGDGEDGMQSWRLTMERTFLLTVESE